MMMKDNRSGTLCPSILNQGISVEVVTMRDDVPPGVYAVNESGALRFLHVRIDEPSRQSCQSCRLRACIACTRGLIATGVLVSATFAGVRAVCDTVRVRAFFALRLRGNGQAVDS